MEDKQATLGGGDILEELKEMTIEERVMNAKPKSLKNISKTKDLFEIFELTRDFYDTKEEFLNTPDPYRRKKLENVMGMITKQLKYRYNYTNTEEQFQWVTVVLRANIRSLREMFTPDIIKKNG